MAKRQTSPDPEAVRRRLTSPHGFARAGAVTPEAIRQMNADAVALNRGTQMMVAEAGLTRTIDLSRIAGYYERLRHTDDAQEIFTAARKFCAENEFARGVIAMKKLLFADGMKLTGRMEDELTRASADLWTEWLTCDNCAAAWVKDGNAAPFVSVPDCEHLKFSDPFGEEALKVRFLQVTLTADQREALGTRYADAYAKGSLLTWGTGPGEMFSALKSSAVHPSGKAGTGFGLPSIRSVFEPLATHALLSMGDWAAAWTAKDVIRLYRRGHKIDSGNLAGMPLHFMSGKESKLIAAEIAKRSGAWNAIANFDVTIDYPIFDFDYFADEKWKGTARRLLDWAGPVGSLLRGDVTPEMRKLAHTEAKAHRAAVAGLLRDISLKCGFGELKVAFCPTTFLTHAEILGAVNSATASALMSPQTARAWLELDSDEESRLMLEAWKDPNKFTPPFEQKQGIVAGEISPPNQT